MEEKINDGVHLDAVELVKTTNKLFDMLLRQSGCPGCVFGVAMQLAAKMIMINRKIKTVEGELNHSILSDEEVVAYLLRTVEAETIGHEKATEYFQSFVNDVDKIDPLMKQMLDLVVKDSSDLAGDEASILAVAGLSGSALISEEEADDYAAKAARASSELH